jgi:protein-disulfide isomerase/uncharacterized membrane protein
MTRDIYFDETCCRLIPPTSAGKSSQDILSKHSFGQRQFSFFCYVEPVIDILFSLYRLSMKNNTSRPIVPLPFPVYFWPVVILTVSGLADSIYLSISHYRVYTDIGYASFCAISKAINCDTVSQSPTSILWGAPVPIWGVFGYACILALLPLAGSKEAMHERIWSLLLGIFLCFSIYSISLGLISALVIHSYCLMCIVSYGINFMLLFYAWLIRRRFAKNGWLSGFVQDMQFLWYQKRMSTIRVILTSSLVFLTMISRFPDYWHLAPPPVSQSVSSGVTDDDHPWIGAETPILVITEFTDYQCFQCKKMHFFLRRMIDAHPDKIRLIHRHYPMDHKVNPIVKDPFHVGSAAMSLVSIYAQTHGKFWEMNDILFNTDLHQESINTRALMKQAGIDIGDTAPNIYDPQIQIRLLNDIREGIKLGIMGTPAYVIEEQVYLGQIPPEILDKITGK